MSELRDLDLEQLQALKNVVGATGRARIDAELERRRRDAARRPVTQRDGLRPSVTDRLEHEEQALIYGDLRKIGCAIYWLSQPRETMQTKGVPDLIVFGPADGQFAFIEVKRQVGGKIRREQSEFAARCRAAGITIVVGDRRDVADHYGYTYEEDSAA